MSVVKEPTAPTSSEPIVYPDTDGLPMAENDWQRELIVECIQVLEHYYRDRRDVYVSGDLLVYFKEGDVNRRIAPDVLVVHGVEKRKRKSFRTWEEGKAPDLVIEIASESTWLRDLTVKTSEYLTLGVREYFLFDSTRERFGPLVGLVRRDGTFAECEPDEHGRLRSEVLELELAEWNRRLRFFRPGEAHPLPTPGERAEQEAARAEQEAARAEQETARAEKEAARAETAERERNRALQQVRELEAELERLRQASE